nr:retrovirus-related Pol polyprotein from transposon TNT 1-94 [Tanacetum cinerariifolium]
ISKPQSHIRSLLYTRLHSGKKGFGLSGLSRVTGTSLGMIFGDEVFCDDDSAILSGEGFKVKTPMVPLNNLGPDLSGKSVNETQYRGFDLKGYSDPDNARCNMDRKSTLGACQLLGGKLKRKKDPYNISEKRFTRKYEIQIQLKGGMGAQRIMNSWFSCWKNIFHHIHSEIPCVGFILEAETIILWWRYDVRELIVELIKITHISRGNGLIERSNMNES